MWKIIQIRGREVMDASECQQEDLGLDTELNKDPVKLLKDWSDVITGVGVGQ